MNNKGQNDKFDDEIFEWEQELGMSLDEFDVEFPNESEIMMTIDAMRPYVPTKESKWATLVASVSNVLQHSTREVFYFSALFWGLNLLFLLLGVLSVVFYKIDPYVMMLYVAPLPTILGFIEVFKSTNTEMAELEMSFKFSLQEIIFSRMVVVGAFNIILNVFLTISFAILLPEVMIGKFILFWVSPLTVIAAIMLVVATKYRGGYTVTGGLVLWTVAVIAITQQDVIERIETISALAYILVTVAATIFIVVKMINIYKRGISYEFNN
ncbi:hypothetical protein [Bacillus sp. REN16]|uniref:hypothetical protein n=1 Tax=Bacillus sp. REN16 TaxID=2887296 RepID=UPI001E5F5F8F|nr:hypothetical protein [Bacillus sp. REN16]MCC3358569.1 hypothetical protein [Bacillus sp. REN16]